MENKETQKHSTIFGLTAINYGYNDGNTPKYPGGLPPSPEWVSEHKSKFGNQFLIGTSDDVYYTVPLSDAENEFEKYRPIQDRLFESDFDKAIKMIEKQ